MPWHYNFNNLRLGVLAFTLCGGGSCRSWG
jgi:hypothetical protein